ncbi:ABC transporter ATP-binding protein [Sphingomonas sp. So64.6b]|uniref:ABC transporter ATP-binding protein n=1 Tax=Sphingomonas sp. So64.6b TaxID=2997354 RepID=UPI0016025FE7|nr:ABC transporter ATP-binding protein [Sphingomonas sp. So64.6b]QNA82596.1 ABC transporter ATP-binding protein [Sphingomonas sp. So64.6b]
MPSALTNPAIVVDNLRYTYAGQTNAALDGISFSVGTGEIFGLLGPSGAGKSTTQKILTRQQRTFGGSVSVLGKPLNKWGQDFFEAIGVGFELPNHYLKFTAVENLKFFASLYRRASRDPIELMAMVGLDKFANKRVETFSKGMRMRLNFVRAIQHDPDLIFLDEPTAGLDPVNAGIVKSIVSDLRKAGKTIVLTTHNMSDVDQLCDRVSFMVDGRFAALNTPEALKALHGRRTVRVTHGAVEESQAEFPLDGLGDNARFLDLLRAGAVRRIHSQEATLDKVFNDVTGHSLDQAEPETAR